MSLLLAAIVHGVVTMAHHMDMIVVAEGIEAREQQDDLARRHYDILLGVPVCPANASGG